MRFLTATIQLIFGILNPAVIVLGGGVMSNASFAWQVVDAARAAGPGRRPHLAQLGRHSVILSGMSLLAQHGRHV